MASRSESVAESPREEPDSRSGSDRRERGAPPFRSASRSHLAMSAGVPVGKNHRSTTARLARTRRPARHPGDARTRFVQEARDERVVASAKAREQTVEASQALVDLPQAGVGNRELDVEHQEERDVLAVGVGDVRQAPFAARLGARVMAALVVAAGLEPDHRRPADEAPRLANLGEERGVDPVALDSLRDSRAIRA